MQFLRSFLLLRYAVASQHARPFVSAVISLCVGKISSGHHVCRWSLLCCTGWSALVLWVGPLIVVGS